jgi:hypothetical protein
MSRESDNGFGLQRPQGDPPQQRTASGYVSRKGTKQKRQREQAPAAVSLETPAPSPAAVSASPVLPPEPSREPLQGETPRETRERVRVERQQWEEDVEAAWTEALRDRIKTPGVEVLNDHNIHPSHREYHGSFVKPSRQSNYGTVGMVFRKEASEEERGDIRMCRGTVFNPYPE